MTKLKKIKKWASRTHRDVEQAEQPADRPEAALREIGELFETNGQELGATEPRRAAFYTGAAGRDETPPAAQVR